MTRRFGICGAIEICAVALSVSVIGCGGSCPGAESAASPTTTSTTERASVAPTDDTSPSASDEHAQDNTPKANGSAPATDTKKDMSGPSPAFPEHATVAQATAAVPSGTERANIDPDTLGEPLKDPAVYEPCKIAGQHFTLRVAVWNGAAVGVDVKAANKKLAECIDQQVRAVQWRAKVPSLNTVDYSM